MLEIAQKTFNNRDPGERKDKRLARIIMVVVFRERPNKNQKYPSDQSASEEVELVLICRQGKRRQMVSPTASG